MSIYSIANSYISTAIPSAGNPAGGNSMRWVNAEADAALKRQAAQRMWLHATSSKSHASS